MTNIPPALPFAHQPNSAAPSHGVIPAPPPSLARLAAGTIVEGVVVGRTAQGLVAVQTSHGEIGVRTTAAPPINTHVVLQLQPTGGQVRVILISSAGRRPAGGEPGQSGGQTSNQSGGQAQSANRAQPAAAPTTPAQASPAPPSARPGAPLPQAPSTQATAGSPLPPPAGPAIAPRAPLAPAAAAPPATPGSPAPPSPAGLGAYQGASSTSGYPVQAAPAAHANPSASGAPRPGAPVVGSPPPGAPPSAAANPTAGQPATPASAGQGATARGAAANPPTPGAGQGAASTSAAPTNAPATSGRAPVPGSPTPAVGSPQGQPAGSPAAPAAPAASATPTGPSGPAGAGAPPPPNSPLAAPAGARGPAGTAPAPGAGPGGALGALGALGTMATAPGGPAANASLAPAAAETAAAGGRAGAATPPSPWLALDRAVEALRQTAVPAVAAAVDAAVPRPGAQLGSALALLMSALRGGDLRGWLGQDTLNEHTRLKGAAATKALADDFSQLSRLARNDSGDWRVFNLPVFDGGQQQQIRLYLKRRGRQGGDAEMPSRFVFELDFSRLGPLQLDGLAARGRFDLVVRSTAPLPESVRGEIGVLFGEVRQANDFKGEVYFQTVPAFTAAAANQPPPRADGLVV